MSNDLRAQYLERRNQNFEDLSDQTAIKQASALDEQKVLEDAAPKPDVPVDVVTKLEKREALAAEEGAEDVPTGLEPGISAETRPEDDLNAKFTQVSVAMGDYVQKLPANITRGVWDSAINATNAIVGVENSEAAGKFIAEHMPETDEAIKSLYKTMEGEGAGDAITQEMAQFMVPFMGWMKAFSIPGQTTGLAKAGQIFAAESATSFTAMDPHMERFAGFVSDLGLDNEFIDWVGRPADSDAEGRFKNVVDNSLLLAGAAPIFMGVAKGWKTLWNAKTEFSTAQKAIKAEQAPDFGIVPRETVPADSPLLTPTNTIKTPEREQLREDLFNARFNVDAKDEKVAIIMGGGGGSGKTTVLKQLQAEGVIPEKGFIDINADDIKEDIPEFQQLVEAGDQRAAAVAHQESSDISQRLIDEGAKAGKAMIIDKTLSKPQNLEIIKSLKSKGYRVEVVGVTVDTGEAIKRAINRFEGGGRFPPTDALIKAHKGFTNNFNAIAELADGVKLFDNNSATPVQIAGATGKKIQILDKTRYNEFVRKGGINEQAKSFQELRSQAQ